MRGNIKNRGKKKERERERERIYRGSESMERGDS
jgi:hypothetical protein